MDDLERHEMEINQLRESVSELKVNTSTIIYKIDSIASTLNSLSNSIASLMPRSECNLKHDSTLKEINELVETNKGKTENHTKMMYSLIGGVALIIISVIFKRLGVM